MPVGQKQVVTDEELVEFKELFNQFDLDGNGHITTKELGEAMKAVGEDVPGYKLRDMMKEVDSNRNGTIEFEEFLTIIRDIRTGKAQYSFTQAVKAKTGIAKKGGTSATSAEGTTHSYSESEKVGFVDYINNWMKDDEDVKKMLPVDAESDAIFEVVKDGILLCKMVNAAAPDTIDRRTINLGKLNLYTKHENCTLALNSAKSIGCCIVNIGAEDIMEGKEHLVLGLLWQVIRMGLFAKIDLAEVPGLVRLLRDGEQIEDLRALSPEELLIRWVNYHLEQDGSLRRISNFSGDIKDSEVYSVLLHAIAPRDAGIDYIELGKDLNVRAESVLSNAERIECRAFVTAKDIVKGNSKLNMAFVANLFNHYPALEPMEDEVEYIEETREEKTFRNWMNSLGVTPRVNYLYNDLNDGLILLQLEDMIQPGIVDWNKVNKRPFKQIGGRMKKIENCNYAVEVGIKMKFSLVGIGGNDIHSGVQTLTLALVWQLMRAHSLKILTDLTGQDKPIQDSEILQWANDKIKASAENPATFTSFKDPSLATSLAILQLIEAIKKGSVTWTNVVMKPKTEEERTLNAQYALSLGRRVGAPFYSLPEDIVEVKPKPLLILFAFLMVVDYANRSSEEAETPAE